MQYQIQTTGFDTVFLGFAQIIQLFKEVRDKILDVTRRARDKYMISNEIHSIEPIKLLELFLGNSIIIIINYFEQIGLDEFWALKHQFLEFQTGK